MDARLIIDADGPASWNMAVDELLVESVTVPTLRFYGWDASSLSLGYFQSHVERLDHAPSLACPVVRRTTGGGAIIHDQELTYCFAAPCDAGSRWSAGLLFEQFHHSLIECLGALGVSASLAVGSAKASPSAPFLCFQRRESGDVLVDAFKIAGSAQRRRRRSILQHGSVLLVNSPQAPELPGILELTGRPIDRRELMERWSLKIARLMGLEFQTQRLTEQERVRAAAIERDVFAHPSWIARR